MHVSVSALRQGLGPICHHSRPTTRWEEARGGGPSVLVLDAKRSETSQCGLPSRVTCPGSRGTPAGCSLLVVTCSDTSPGIITDTQVVTCHVALLCLWASQRPCLGQSLQGRTWTGKEGGPGPPQTGLLSPMDSMRMPQAQAEDSCEWCPQKTVPVQTPALCRLL